MVTGAGGMLAHAVLPLLEAHGHEVLALRHADVDVTRCEQVRQHAQAFRPQWLVHLAAFTNVDACESDADRAYVVNGLGARNSSMAAADVGAGLIALSTDYVFDGATRAPRREHDIVGPLSVYGRSKLAGERGAREVNMRHIIVRTQWLYGAGGRNFVDTILAKARAGEPLSVVDDQTGAPTWTGDLAQALVQLLERGEYGTYHVTNSGECTWHEFAVEICHQAGIEAKIARLSSEELARPARRPAYSVLHNGWYRHVTGQNMPAWRDALASYLKSGVA
ncbi:MAG: dTDP-4-dehydrorhamnose reductase [Candidatus Eisenbacteria bacterium]